MPQLYLYDQSEKPFDPIDNLVHRWGDVVAPIFVNSKKSKHAVSGRGSSFLITHDSRLFLVTAHHVVKDVTAFRHQIANIQGKAVHLGGLGFTVSTENDIAVAELTNAWLADQGLARVKTLSTIERDHQWRRTGIFVLLGYPASKNQLDARFGKVNRYMHSITAEKFSGRIVSIDVQDAIFFSYDHKNMINSELTALGEQPSLNGMSGGPSVEVLAKQMTDGTYTFTLSFAGVLCEWHKTERAVIAAPASSVLDLIAR